MTLIEIISKYDLCNAGGGTDKSSTHAYVEQFYVFHYKNASNSNVWQNEEYNSNKTTALYNVLNEYIYNGRKEYENN